MPYQVLWKWLVSLRYLTNREQWWYLINNFPRFTLAPNQHESHNVDTQTDTNQHELHNGDTQWWHATIPGPDGEGHVVYQRIWFGLVWFGLVWFVFVVRLSRWSSSQWLTKLLTRDHKTKRWKGEYDAEADWRVNKDESFITQYVDLILLNYLKYK